MILLTINEVCKRLSISRSAFYRLVKSGDLPTVKLGGAVRIDEDDLRKLVARSTNK